MMIIPHHLHFCYILIFHSNYRSVVECLEEFGSCRPSLEILLKVIPLLRPRQFSVASSALGVTTGTVDTIKNGSYLDLCVGLLSKTTPYGRQRLGVCSSYLCSLPIMSKVSIWVRKGTFRVPVVTSSSSPSSPSSPTPPSSSSSSLIPLVLVGPGTGVAPMKAIICERIKVLTSLYANNSSNVIDDDNLPLSLLLFYGCRKRYTDFLYAEEWTKSQTIGGLGFQIISEQSGQLLLRRVIAGFRLEIHCAFSRDIPLQEQTPELGGRVYVTKLIKERGNDLIEMIGNGNGKIFVAGSANRMPADVRKAFIQAFSTADNTVIDEMTAETILNRMTKSKDYYVEAWS